MGLTQVVTKSAKGARSILLVVVVSAAILVFTYETSVSRPGPTQCRLLARDAKLKTATQQHNANPAPQVVNSARATLPVTDEIFHAPKKIDYETESTTTSALWSGGCPNETSFRHGACTTARRKLLFVKVHKCGSSTLTAMVLRYSIRNQLTVAMPKYTDGHFGYPMAYRSRYVHDFKTETEYDIAASHMVYDRCFVQRDFPREKTIYVTILREPWSQFVSVVNFFDQPEINPPKLMKPRIRNILFNPFKYAIPIPFRNLPNLAAKKNLLRNMMATDLGFPQTGQFDNQTAIKLFIERLDKDFDLIMITERFHESLVLLKRLMCWTMKDILYVKLNKRGVRWTDSEKITEEFYDRHRVLDNVDYQVYSHFRAKFQTLVEQQGPGFSKEVDQFTAQINVLDSFCNVYQTQSKTLPRNDYMDALVVTRNDCAEMKKMPINLMSPLKKAAKSSAKTSSSVKTASSVKTGSSVTSSKTSSSKAGNSVQTGSSTDKKAI